MKFNDYWPNEAQSIVRNEQMLEAVKRRKAREKELLRAQTLEEHENRPAPDIQQIDLFQDMEDEDEQHDDG